MIMNLRHMKQKKDKPEVKPKDVNNETPYTHLMKKIYGDKYERPNHHNLAQYADTPVAQRMSNFRAYIDEANIPPFNAGDMTMRTRSAIGIRSESNGAIRRQAEAGAARRYHELNRHRDKVQLLQEELRNPNLSPRLREFMMDELKTITIATEFNFD